MVCLVTGSSRGLGKAIALAFGRRGRRVVIHYNERKEEASIVAAQIKESIVLSADVRDYNQVRSLVDTVTEQWGGIDILVNNAGVTREALLLKTSEEEFDEVVDTNLKGPVNFMRAASPYMIKQNRGHIINISSIAGVSGKAGLSAYSASKAGLIGLTKSAARELGEHNVMVNAVLPGFMLTDMGARSNDRAKGAALADSLMKDFSDPRDVAEFICRLSGTRGISGQVFNLDSRLI
ncbi:MAG: SDR family oxidoreductase [Nitrospirae bacterium]|nr:SDR family oxidoreductase [Nitrospirota bacterium]